MPKTAQQITENFRNGIAGAGTKYRQGVESPKADWAEQALASQDLMVRNFQRAVANGDVSAGIQRTGSQGWRQKTLDKADRFTASAERAAQGYQQVAQQVIQAGEAARVAAQAIPKGGIDNALQKVRAAIEAQKRTWGKPLD